jgi:DNA-binding protein H-NS
MLNRFEIVRRTGMALKSMSLDKLMKLKSDVDAVLASKISEQRHALESELSKLGRFAGGGKLKGKRGGQRGSVAPKYRNPEDPSETWAGRGLRPRWLAAALKSGKKLEDFAISGPLKKGRGRKKA